jgi:hypothetical protein
MAKTIFFCRYSIDIPNTTSVKPNKNPKPNTIFKIRTNYYKYQNIKRKYYNL